MLPWIQQDFLLFDPRQAVLLLAAALCLLPPPSDAGSWKIHNNFGVTNRIRRARGIPQEGIRTLGQPEDFKLSSVHLHLTEGSPSACLRLLADWIRTIDLQIYLGEKLL
ncbi:hypothetical protein ATANTOWER_019295 [Ataeniobius toweri]|uniref:Uncharacterized protein n=1 Tax=Ataeniobius toweri TaxID=208326 RepID=A0ABU7B7G8_9TELE|nr:hypothetical protein [Ataeniobius toweri]